MKVFGFLLRVWSYVFHLILSLFLLGLGLISYPNPQALKLIGFLPFTSENVIRGIVTLGAVGLISTVLAMTGIFKYLFPVWTAIILYLIVRGGIFSPFAFAGENAFKGFLWLAFGAIGAFFGGFWVLKPRRGRL